MHLFNVDFLPIYKMCKFSLSLSLIICYYRVRNFFTYEKFFLLKSDLEETRSCLGTFQKSDLTAMITIFCKLGIQSVLVIIASLVVVFLILVKISVVIFSFVSFYILDGVGVG